MSSGKPTILIPSKKSTLKRAAFVLPELKGTFTSPIGITVEPLNIHTYTFTVTVSSVTAVKHYNRKKARNKEKRRNKEETESDDGEQSKKIGRRKV